jgi:hypothetical protein
MMPLHHGWGWYPPQTASHIHIRHCQCVWAIGILPRGHMDAPLYCYTSKVGPRFWNLCHLWSENVAITSWLRLTSTSDCFSHPYKTYKMCLKYCVAVSRANGCTLTLLYLSLPQILNFWITCGVEMMPLHDGWVWYPPQTVSQIWARHIQNVWAIDMLSQGHMGAPLYRYTGQVGPRFWTFGSLVEWKWCHYIMVEADIHLILLLTFIEDIYNVFEVLFCCLNGIWMHPCIVIPAKVASDLGIWVTCGVKMMPLCDGWGWYPPQTTSHIHIRHIKCVWGTVLLSQGYISAPLYSYTN